YTRAQEALRISEERYRIVSELTSDYHFSVRVDADGTMEREWISEAFNRITGYEPDELSEAQWEQLVHPDDHAIRREQFVTAINTGSLIHEYRILRKSGELRWIREHARVIRDEDGSLHWYGACQDITERKLAENERALTQERFDAITRSSRDIITEIDASGRALYVSPNVAEITGFPPEHFTAERRSEVVHPEDQKVVTERITKMMSTGESEALVYRMRNREGAWRWMDATATAFHTSNGEIRAVMISRDISDRLEMEDERRRLSSVVENSSELIAMMDADGRLLFLNDAGRELVGVRETDRIRDLTIFDFLCAEDAQDMRFTVVPTAQQSHHWEGDFQLRHRMSGAHIATLAHVFLVATQRHEGGEVLAIVARDISERIRSEKLLRESEARHRLLVESAYDLIAEFDSDGRFAYVSPNFQRQLGYSPDELLEGFWLDVVHPEDRESARVAVAEAVASVTREWPPLRLRHRDGGWRWVEINLKQYESISGEELLLAFFRDITRRKLAEEALRQSQEQLLHAQKMEAIGRLAGGVAHDFNNLLTAITGYGDLLLEEIGDAEPLRNDAEEIIRAAERAAGLTRQLLAFSRRQVLAPKVLDLNSLVADVESLLRRLIGEDIDLSTRLDAHRPWVRLDPGQLEQLVMNLSVNARDAMPQGGRLEIATANLSVRDDDGRTHPGVAPADYVTLTVQDTGEGMRPQIVSKIFEPFFTTKEVNKGTGLGLATVYGIIRQSGGEIRVESRPGEGSTFTVYLPQVDEEPMAPAPLESGDELRGHETILLVEDSDTVRNLMRRYFEKQGYTVLAAASGTDALQVAAGHGDPIDLLVTDVVLPRMDGHELSQLLKRLQPDLEVLFVSGFSEDTLSRHGVVASDIDLIQKPFSPPTLLRAARRVLSGASHGDRP
ncbi:MAG: PAS domain S-box protein, partial [Gaiellales bacterium]